MVKIGAFRQQPGGYQAFIPAPFPPRSGFALPPIILKKNTHATLMVGKLDGITTLLPDVDFFLLMYLRKDAASSSQIEGTLATMVDAIEAEVSSGEQLPDDVDDIVHYIKALHHGIKRTQEEGFPLSLRFIRELHHKLAAGARATHFSNPGEFRTSQNWIGGTNPNNARFVPPPVDEMKKSLADLEKFLYTKDDIPVLIRAALIHAQFETIHPFLDGNGRTGRMLITFFLLHAGYLKRPVLYLSSYFKRHQKMYYDRLEGYHQGQVLPWVEFFLDGIIEISGDAIQTVEKITALREQDVLKVQTLGSRAAQSAAKVLPRLYAQPIVNVAVIKKWTGFTRQGALNVIKRFSDMGILVSKSEDKKYGQLFFYRDYLKIFTDI